VARGARVLGAVRPDAYGLVTKAGATPVAYGPGLVASVQSVVPSVDAVIDASGAGLLGTTVEVLLSTRA
jgi:hypothetical protein